MRSAATSLFIAAGLCWASMLTLLRLRAIDSVRATVIISVLSLLIYAPLHAVLFGFDNMLAVGWKENLLQIVIQGILSGPARDLSVGLCGERARRRARRDLLGAGAGLHDPGRRAGARRMADAIQLGGLAVVAVGFRLVMKR